MDILTITHFLNGLLMVAMPVVLGIYLVHKFGLGWRLWLIGAATFVLSQVGHLPFNQALTILFRDGILPTPPDAWLLPFNALVFGLSAGLWEEFARYATYRWWARDARTWKKGLMLGAGHGGIEAILLGLLVMVTFVNMVVIRDADLSSQVSPEQLSMIESQMQIYWSAPWYATLLGAVERAFTIPFHLAASLLVMQVFIRRQLRWLWLAIAWHTLLNAGALIAAQLWGAYIAELIIGVTALINLIVIFALRTSGDEPIEVEQKPIIKPSQIKEQTPMTELPPIDESVEKLEETRYN